MNNPFRPAATVSLSATTSTGRVVITASTGVGEYRVYNAGPSTVFIKEGDNTVIAAVTDMPIPAGAVEVLSFGSTNIAGITSTGTATLYITSGDGI